MTFVLMSQALEISSSTERTLLEMPQVECPVAHHFGPGIYIREVTMPPGIFAVGHRQKKRHLNVMIAGKVVMADGDKIQVLEAPFVYVSEPGRKISFILETTVWQNIYATTETDIDKLEEMFLDKSETYKQFDQEQSAIEQHLVSRDNEDFKSIPDVFKLHDETTAFAVMPEAFKVVTTVRNSDIHGKGLFLNWSVKKGAAICPLKIGACSTIAGRYINHSSFPNCKCIHAGNDVVLVSDRDISGNKGGSKGEELTIDYRLGDLCQALR